MHARCDQSLPSCAPAPCADPGATMIIAAVCVLAIVVCWQMWCYNAQHYALLQEILQIQKAMLQEGTALAPASVPALEDALQRCQRLQEHAESAKGTAARADSRAGAAAAAGRLCRGGNRSAPLALPALTRNHLRSVKADYDDYLATLGPRTNLAKFLPELLRLGETKQFYFNQEPSKIGVMEDMIARMKLVDGPSKDAKVMPNDLFLTRTQSLVPSLRLDSARSKRGAGKPGNLAGAASARKPSRNETSAVPSAAGPSAHRLERPASAKSSSSHKGPREDFQRCGSASSRSGAASGGSESASRDFQRSGSASSRSGAASGGPSSGSSDRYKMVSWVSKVVRSPLICFHARTRRIVVLCSRG